MVKRMSRVEGCVIAATEREGEAGYMPDSGNVIPSTRTSSALFGSSKYSIMSVSPSRDQTNLSTTASSKRQLAACNL